MPLGFANQQTNSSIDISIYLIKEKNTFPLLNKWKQALIVIAKCFALLVILYMFICSLSFLASAFKLLGGKTAGKNLKIHSFSRRPKFSENVIFLWEIYIFQANYSGPHFRAFGLNTERYGISIRIQSKCGKMRARITPNADIFHRVLS